MRYSSSGAITSDKAQTLSALTAIRAMPGVRHARVSTVDGATFIELGDAVELSSRRLVAGQAVDFLDVLRSRSIAAEAPLVYGGAAVGELVITADTSELGEQIWVCDGQGSRYLMELTRVTKQELAGRILNTSREPARSAPRLLIGQAVLKGEKMDWVIQKATELGASEIVLLQSRHTIVQLRPERLDAQLARWQRIALEAAQQRKPAKYVGKLGGPVSFIFCYLKRASRN